MDDEVVNILQVILVYLVHKYRGGISYFQVVRSWTKPLGGWWGMPQKILEFGASGRPLVQSEAKIHFSFDEHFRPQSTSHAYNYAHTKKCGPAMAGVA